MLGSSVASLIFFRGYTRGVMRLAIVVALAFFAVNAAVVGCGVAHLIERPDLVEAWWADVWAGQLTSALNAALQVTKKKK